MISIILVNLIGLAFVIFGIVLSGTRPQALLYAFILNYLAQLLTLEAMMRVHRRTASPRVRAVLERLSRRPEPGRESYPVTEESTGRPARIGGYLVVAAVFALFGFMAANVNAERELDLEAATLGHDLSWACFLTSVYWGQGLILRWLVIDFRAAREVNYGYNTADVAVLALGVLTAGAVVVVRQQLERGPSGWVVLGPLLAWRTLYDISAGVMLAKRRAG
jgi:hypothetical protein